MKAQKAQVRARHFKGYAAQLHGANMFSRRRGVSELKATIVLLAITVAAALLLYAISIGYIRAALPGGVEVTVEAASLVRASDGSSIFSCVLKNIGSKAVERLTIQFGYEVQDEVPNVSEDSPLEPGGSVAYEMEPVCDYKVGETYTFVVNAYSQSGGDFSKAFSVVCQGTPSMPSVIEDPETLISASILEEEDYVALFFVLTNMGSETYNYTYKVISDIRALSIMPERDLILNIPPGMDFYYTNAGPYPIRPLTVTLEIYKGNRAAGNPIFRQHFTINPR